MINKPIVVFMVVLLVGMTAVGTVFAAGQRDSGVSEEQTYLFKYGNQQPEDHSRTVSMLWFAEELQRRSNGRIEVEVYHSGVLGTEREMFEMTVTGALQGYRGAFYEQLNPQFNLYNLPFLFQNYDELIHFNASDMARDMLERGSVQGIYMPAVGFTGLRALATTTGLIREPADLRGLQVRSPGQAPILEFYRHFRAVPQEIPWGDVYMAVRQRVVDGGDNAPTNLLAARLYEVAPYVTALNYMAGADPFMVNMAWYQSLPDDLKAIFNEVSVEALQYWDRLEAEATLDAIAEIAAQPGAEVLDMSDHPELAAVWEEASTPLWQRFVDQGFFTWDDIRRAQAIIDEVRR